MGIEDFWQKLLEEYESNGPNETTKRIMAEYALACLHDKELAEEAFNLVKEADHA